MKSLPRPTLPQAAGAALTLLLLAGCSGAPPRSRADAATAAACRERANEVYNKQNRAEVYRADSYATQTRDSPFAASGLPGITSAGLSGLFARQTMESDCIAGAAGNVGGTDSAGEAAIAPSPGPATPAAPAAPATSVRRPSKP